MNKEQIQNMLIDMIIKSEIEVYRKYGIGIQIQRNIKKEVVDIINKQPVLL